MKSNCYIVISICLHIVVHCSGIHAQSLTSSFETDYYPIDQLPIPEGVDLAASGLAFNEQGDLMVSTRAEIWRVTNPGGETPSFDRFAHGLMEPLGIAYSGNAWFVVQMGELTKLMDQNKDGKADRFQTIYKWPLAGHYHEYSFGPEFLPNGEMAVTHALTMPGVGVSLAKWRGWMLHISKDGQMTPYATGLRSPNGIGLNAEGDIFYSENQGRWVGSGRITHLEKGDFAGNPEGLRWAHLPESPLDLQFDTIYNLKDYPLRPMHEYSKKIANLKLPAVWIPHPVLGVSTSDILLINRGDQIGPFTGQFLVGDFGHAAINRVYLEQIKGEYQGAVFRFREGFPGGVQNLEWGPDNKLYVAMRGWASPGGVGRLAWNGKIPFEIKSIEAKSNGFTITFTYPVELQSAEAVTNYKVTDFTYPYHRHYYSNIMNREAKTITRVEVSDDQKSVRLYVDGLREGYINEIKTEGIHSAQGMDLLHPTGYYTLNSIPEGERSAGTVGKEMNSTEANKTSLITPSEKKITELPVSWAKRPDQTVRLEAGPGLIFDRKIITVEAGSRIALILVNNDDMLHNVVIVKPGTSDSVGQEALQLGLDAEAQEYIPDTEDVLYHSSLLGASERETIYFQAPDVPGEYEFICSYAGHYTTMKGIFRVLSK